MKLIETTYKGVKISECVCLGGVGTYFKTDLNWHDDPTVRKVNIFGPDLETTKTMIDDRLEELNIKTK